MDPSTVHGLVTVLMLVLTWILLRIWKNRDLPPGPLGVPLLGYYPFISSKPYLDFARLAKQYGDIFSFRSVGGTLFVALNGPKLIKDVLVSRSEEFIGRPLQSNLLEWISDGLGITQEEGSPWKRHRRFFLQTVKQFGFGKIEFEGTIQEELKILNDDLRKADSQPTDFAFHVGYAVNSVIAQIIFARKFEKYGKVFPKLVKAVRDLIKIFGDHRFMLVGLPYTLAINLMPWSSSVREGRAFLKSTVKEIIDDHVDSFDPNHQRDYVDGYLCERERLKESGQSDDNSFTMERLLSISMNMIMEGTDTVAASITGLLVEASRHPEEQRKVQEELDGVVGRERLPSWHDRPKLPYLDAFIQELFRTAQIFYITTHYCNFVETTINNFRIPRRSIIVANLWSINNDPRTFPKPSEFDVGRFLGEDGKKIKTEGPYPYSMGKRDCVGQSLAQMEVFLIVASVLQNFTLQPGEQFGFLKAIPRD